MSYNAPGINVQDVVSGSQAVELESSSVGIMLGVTRSGVIGVAQKVTSWTEFISAYANGLDTPFLENSYLPYSVHGFFNNGGKELYIGSIKKSDAIKATTISTTNAITATATSEGVWGNDIKVSIKKSAEYDEDTNKSFDVTIALGNNDSTTIIDVTKENINDVILVNSKANKWLSEFSMGEVEALAEEEFTLKGGSDGGEITDSDYINALSMIDILTDVTFVAIPGQTSEAVNSAVIEYCSNNGLFPMIDMPMGSTAEATKMYRKTIDSLTGSLCHPWGKIIDPLTNSLKAVPTVGHVMGVYARIIESRGVHKAPAGVDAVVNGFVEMEYQLTSNQIEMLNPIGVICITSRPNTGIVIWGARSLNSSDSTMRYVTDGLLNLNIKRFLYNDTQFAVFEPNTEELRSKVNGVCKAYLETLRASGALKGVAEEAYYVTVDGTNNTEETIANGELHIEVGYAPVKPAEFVIIKLAHSIVS